MHITLYSPEDFFLLERFNGHAEKSKYGSIQLS